MQVKLLVSRATATGAENRGETVEVQDAEAIRMIEAGQAEPVRGGPTPERATRKQRIEKATK
jgi:hypothetical protein